MQSWLSSWLPGLPSLDFTLPASLQGKFISFVLKKTLGHFLRPGQLDSRQVDSQIGSGFVQINELELDNEAINALLSDLPITLHDGYISSALARIPWPNPLTSTVGFSLKSLHLTFHLHSSSLKQSQGSVNLADSVLSVAESFMHDELTPKETRLWDSYHVDGAPPMQSDDNINFPGGIDPDPFLSNPEDILPSDIDPAGVSIFATLIERLLARFEFDAVNTIVTLVHPGNMSITASIADIRYRTEVVADSSSGTPSGQRRMATIAGVTLTTRNLRHHSSSDSVAQDLSTGSRVSPTSSCSDLDEETQFAMSQSLAALPPRMGASIESSIYHSIISTSPVPSCTQPHIGQNAPPAAPRTKSAHGDDMKMSTSPEDFLGEDVEDHTLLSFGSSPIVLEVTDQRSPLSQGVQPPLSSTIPYEKAINGSLRFSVTVGLVAVALSPWTVRGILGMLQAGSHHTVSSSAPNPTATSTADMVATLSLEARGIVILILLPSGSSPQPNPSMALADYFKRPLVHPPLSSGYYRLFIDGISGRVLPNRSFPTAQKSGKTKAPSQTNPIATHFSISDVSIFSVFESSTTASLVALPILLTDRDLPTQYSSTHLHPRSFEHSPTLPTFEIMDWTDEKYHSHGSKSSMWRTKVNRNREQVQAVGIGPSSPKLSSTTHSSPAITITGRLSGTPHQKSPGNEIEVQITPLHILLDLGKVDKFLAFLDEVLDDGVWRGGGHHMTRDDSNYLDSDSGETPPASPRARNVSQGNKDRLGLKTLAQSDINLGFDYGGKLPGEENFGKKKRVSEVASQRTTTISARFDMIRLQLRCPPPPGRPPRSGALILDLHDVTISTAPWASRHTARFASDNFPPAAECTQGHQNFLLGSQIRRLVVACSTTGGHVATSIFSSGPIETESNGDPTSGPDTAFVSAIQPRFSITKSNVLSDKSPSIVACCIELPSIHVEISKNAVDSLQYWIDDLSQLIERISRCSNDEAEDNTTSNVDLIGSRFFAKSRSASTLSTGSDAARYETVVKVAISEALIWAMVPRAKEPEAYPFILRAAEVDFLFEMNSEGKDESVLTLGIMDLAIHRIQGLLGTQTLLALTAPRSLSSTPKSMVKLRFVSLLMPETTAKESKVKLTMWGFTFTLFPDIGWISDLAAFSKSPPGTFEGVIPSERTSIHLKIYDGSVRALAPQHPGAIVVHVGDLEFSTQVVGNSPESTFRLLVPALAVLVVDDASGIVTVAQKTNFSHGVTFWQNTGFALLCEVADLAVTFNQTTWTDSPCTRVAIDRVVLRGHLCADSLTAVTALTSDISSVFSHAKDEREEIPQTRPAIISPTQPISSIGLMDSVDDLAFRKLPEVGPAPDMINDDLPTNLDYLDESFGSAAGLRELSDDEFDVEELPVGSDIEVAADGTGIVSRVGGETIKMLRPEGICVVDNYFQTLPREAVVQGDESEETAFHLRVYNGDITLLLYDGYDWLRTRKVIENEAKEIRRRLARIRQLVATGEVTGSNVEETSTLLFNSVHIGLDQDVDGLEPGAILAAIDEELRDDAETASQSSWHSLQPPMHVKVPSEPARIHGKRLTRSKSSSIEFRFMGLKAEVDHYQPEEPVVSRTLVTVRDVEILDHIKTSTWKKFLTELRSDSRGNVRETDSNMVRVEVRSVRPVPGHPSQEARLRAKILPLRLYVDQDAVDFLKRFFSFKDPSAPPPETSSEEIYFQSAEVFPVDLKLDYKPRRVDYRALREGRTIELMNFFHFDGAEMTLRHITLAGITGWSRLFELLNDLWTPDVKATQLVEVISGVAPIRSVVNVGSGVADLVLLPIAQYKKDGRIIRGVQKGTTAFVRSTATEAIKLGARLATGTQVILEQAEGILGGQFQHAITAETVQGISGDDFLSRNDEDDSVDISKYAQQPEDLTEGIQSAYKSLRKNLNSAAQTILAVPMEVYERSENEGPVRAVIRAVPIAVLKPMIGASEAVSKTLLGLHNSLDPGVRHDNEAKYKHR